MNKLIKVGAIALFSLFVAACNKADPAADFKKLTDWQNAQTQSFLALQNDLQQKVATQDPAQIEEAVKTFTAKIEETQKTLDALDIQSDEIKPLKEKIKNAFVLSNELMADSIKVIQTPPSDPQQAQQLQQALQSKMEAANKAAQELVTLQAELQNKYGK